jgi:hypothetical protein
MSKKKDAEKCSAENKTKTACEADEMAKDSASPFRKIDVSDAVPIDKLEREKHSRK